MARDGLVVVDVVATEQEAEFLCGLLLSTGMDCLPRQTYVGAGASDGMSVVGAVRVVVHAEDLEAARESKRLARYLRPPVDRIADLFERGPLEALGPRPLDAEGVRLAGGGDDRGIAGETLALVAGDRERLLVGTLDPLPTRV